MSGASEPIILEANIDRYFKTADKFFDNTVIDNQIKIGHVKLFHARRGLLLLIAHVIVIASQINFDTYDESNITP